MKNTLAFLSALALTVGTLKAQEMYTTTGGEWIFSFPNGDIGGADLGGPVRFAPVVNIQSYLHIDRGEKFGLLSGLALRNVGFIYDDPVIPETRYKVRSYNIGIPLGIKVGNMTGTYLFAAYEFEFPIHYKRKTFVNEDKQDNKQTAWFSNQLPAVYQGVMVGVQVAQGAQIKFKYYLTDFYKKDYTDASSTQPWANFNASTMYISLSMQILKGTDYYYKRGE